MGMGNELIFLVMDECGVVIFVEICFVGEVILNVFWVFKVLIGFDRGLEWLD